MKSLKAHAKINLTLDIIGKRADGFHDMKMIMQSLSLADEITVQPKPTSGTYVETNLDYLPTGDNNLAGKAVATFYKNLNQTPKSYHIKIEKNIPVCAGLAGGSTDAATVLKILNEMENFPYTQEKLCEIGQQVGSDVPFCIISATALAEGKGEILSPLPPLPHCSILLCKPNFSLSTPVLFGKISNMKLSYRPDTDGIIKSIQDQDLKGVSQRLFNVFEEALTPHQRLCIEEIKNTMLDHGALGSSMSGSGPTVFGIFTEESQAKEAAAHLQEDFPETFLTTPV